MSWSIKILYHKFQRNVDSNVFFFFAELVIINAPLITYEFFPFKL